MFFGGVVGIINIHTGTPMFQNSHTPVSYDLLGVSQHKLDCNIALSYTNQDLDEKCQKFYLLTNLQAKITLNIWSKSKNHTFGHNSCCRSHRQHQLECQDSFYM